MSSSPQPRSRGAGAGADDEHAGGAGGRARLRRRRRALRRFDILLGLVAGAVWLLVAPGVAMAGIVAAFVLLAAGVSLLVGRRRGRRSGRRRSRRARG